MTGTRPYSIATSHQDFDSAVAQPGPIPVHHGPITGRSTGKKYRGPHSIPDQQLETPRCRLQDPSLINQCMRCPAALVRPVLYHLFSFYQPQFYL